MDEDGEVCGDFEYSAWGAPLHEEVNGAETRFRYQSNWICLDDSAGELLLSPTRLYHSGLGRFLQRDPLGFVDGWNLYNAFSGNPSLSIDPVGLENQFTFNCARSRAFVAEMKDLQEAFYHYSLRGFSGSMDMTRNRRRALYSDFMKYAKKQAGKTKLYLIRVDPPKDTWGKENCVGKAYGKRQAMMIKHYTWLKIKRMNDSEKKIYWEKTFKMTDMLRVGRGETYTKFGKLNYAEKSSPF